MDQSPRNLEDMLSFFFFDCNKFGCFDQEFQSLEQEKKKQINFCTYPD